ncbi:ABC transporter permease [Cytobacillus horneckiae]|uniref:ABC transporter permease n=1 Tax=Cytobacillus horneckiae TaxID=549687 RepID=UPI003D9A640D
MNLSIKRLMAIFNKDYKDLSRNMYVSFTVVVPLFLAAFMGRQGNIALEQQYMVYNLTLCLVTAYIQCALIAEEKEKNTLRNLMLSPASTMEILAGKGLLSFATTLLVLGLSAFFLDYMPKDLVVVAAAMVLSAIFYIGLGTALGLMTKSAMEASVIIMPFVFVFSFGTSLSFFADKYPFLHAADYLPNAQLLLLAKEVELGAGFADVWSNLGIIAIWVVVMTAITVAIYRKRMVD